MDDGSYYQVTGRGVPRSSIERGCPYTSTLNTIETNYQSELTFAETWCLTRFSSKRVPVTLKTVIKFEM